jgi:SAM-dependent methyltransferase
LPLPGSISPSFEVWKRLGSDLLLDIEVRLRRSAILAHCFEEFEAEFDELIQQIELHDDLQILDIGCGLGVMDVLLCRRVSVSRLGLVDIEKTAARHHGFRNEGAGYNSLATAAKFIAGNIPDGTRIETLNPKERDVRSLGSGFNLITSFLSCGYHYPASTYLEVFRTLLAPGGQIVLDLRLGQDHQPLLDDFEVRQEIGAHPDRRRIVLTRIGSAKV